MEEARDLRELKNLLSGLSLQDNATQSLDRREPFAIDAAAQKIVLLKSASVFLLSLSLFLFLSLSFVVVRVYTIGPAHNDTRQTMVQPPVREAVPAAPEPAPVASAPSASAVPAVHQAVTDEQAPAAQGGPSAQPEEPPVTTVEDPAVVLKEAGGSLYFAALKHYGKADETMFDLILQANPAITDVRKIDDYQKIILPDITAESYIKGSSQKGYRVYAGTFDTARWAEIYGASMKRNGKLAYIEARHFSPQDTWYRLTIGDFDTKEEALQTVQSLQKRGLIYIPSRSG